ncbi:hypothetical protein L332_05060 [Agrococcus pavilionensis RW1]|uniref:YetF C-terminal domain-containing protein n=1 Tax=Agrococcus pavilionensis RW1 TaxID=1330458 RepID=U1MT63_9MICO|nr:YetF domain-containing protein [Agrococcus pavilionensis]ERG63840.1 hypothetical protein L332_05060 [Agrococcus pavilionensis RW1]
MPDWGEVFGLTVPVLEIVARGSVMFLALTVLLRVVGQREAGGLGITDILIVVLVADAAGAGMRGEAGSIGDSLVLVGTILFWSVALDALGYRWPALGRLLKARPKPLIEDGRLNRRALRREFMSRDELESQLRLHGLTDISQVKRAWLEPNGMVSVLPVEGKPSEEPPERPAR